jgi:histidyl-tRNA synthetase
MKELRMGPREKFSLSFLTHYHLVGKERRLFFYKFYLAATAAGIYTDLMNTQVQTLKGFRDFLGVEARKREWLANKIKGVFEKFGYEPLETPALEYKSLLMGKYGEEADKLIYNFEDNGGREVALRYDQTIPTARVMAQYQNDLVLPYKRYQVQPVWRADKPQKGRFREFTQCDIDIIGTNSVMSDAEVLAVMAEVYKKLGFSIKMKVNDRKLLFSNIKNAGVSEEMVMSVIQSIDKLDKKSKEEVQEELRDKEISPEVVTKLFEIIDAAQPSEELLAIIKTAEQMGVGENVLEFTPTLARGLDYYTGLIAEIIIPEFPYGSVCGGGRYDKLLNDLVGRDLPAVGMSIGFDRTLEAAEGLGKLPVFEGTAQVLVTIFSPELSKNSLKVAAELRQKGVSVELYLDPAKKLEAQLKYANRKGIPYVVVVGPEEASKNVVKLKNMKNGEQKEIFMNEISEMVKK